MYYKRILYLGYYLKELDREKFNKFLQFTAKKTGKSKAAIIADVVASSLRYNISFLEYFLFHFYALTAAERKKYVGTGYIYEYQLKMNPKSARRVLEDKIEFLQHYKEFIRHQYASLTMLEQDPTLAVPLLNNTSGKLVLKSASGQCGAGVEVRRANEFDSQNLIDRLKETGNDLVEEYVVQHDELMRLSPSGLNTLRLVTQLTEDNRVVFVAARLRISVNSAVDNLAAGNLAAPVNLETGIVDGPAVYSDITRSDETIHPVTGTEIMNFKIPFWEECLEMVRKAALISKGNRSIGWDVAITNEGPELIEGNHNWCKLLWQLPVKKGLKSELQRMV